MQISRDSRASKAPQPPPLTLSCLQLLPYYYGSPFPYPRSLASSVSHLPGTRVFVPLTAVLPLVSCVPGPPIYLALRLTLGLL